MLTVANLKIDARAPDGEEFVVSVEIGVPYRVQPGRWACPVAIEGIWGRLPDAQGADALQALCLAIGLAQGCLQTFRDKGGALQIGGQDFPFEAYAIIPPPAAAPRRTGKMIRKAPASRSARPARLRA